MLEEEIVITKKYNKLIKRIFNLKDRRLTFRGSGKTWCYYPSGKKTSTLLGIFLSQESKSLKFKD